MALSVDYPPKTLTALTAGSRNRDAQHRGHFLRYAPLRTSSGDNVFKSAEEREAERREREAAQAREQAARAEQARIAEEQRKRDAFMATPVGAATYAKEQGQTFFEVQLEVGSHTGSAGFGSA